MISIIITGNHFLKKIKPLKPKIITCNEHNISQADISKNALKVLARLEEYGFEAYLVGGGVRDLLLGLHPKDFDIATNARPEQVKKIFRNCRIIGKRFRLAHVFSGPEIIEVATFRGNSTGDVSQRAQSTTGMITRDNVYGTLEEDVWRRDFTINALYYKLDGSIIDYAGGMDDMHDRVVRIIGSPKLRCHEDPLRMLRAVRIAAKVGFRVDHETAECLSTFVGLLQNVAPARLFDEVVKWFKGGKSLVTFEMCRNYGLFAALFPQTEARLVGENSALAKAFVWQGFNNTDKRIAENKSLNPAFLFAILLWPPFQHKITELQKNGMKFGGAFQLAMSDVLRRQKKHLAITQRFVLTIEEIWLLQYRLIERKPSKITHIFNHKKFRAAYDFLELRSLAHDDVQEHVAWWKNYQANHIQDESYIDSINEQLSSPRKKIVRPAKKGVKSNFASMKTAPGEVVEFDESGIVYERADMHSRSRNNEGSIIELLSKLKSNMQ